VQRQRQDPDLQSNWRKSLFHAAFAVNCFGEPRQYWIRSIESRIDKGYLAPAACVVLRLHKLLASQQI
jgi:hypothetical protein